MMVVVVVVLVTFRLCRWGHHHREVLAAVVALEPSPRQVERYHTHQLRAVTLRATYALCRRCLCRRSRSYISTIRSMAVLVVEMVVMVAAAVVMEMLLRLPSPQQ